jgi:hypothetical protein
MIDLYYSRDERENLVNTIILIIRQQIFPKSLLKDISPVFSGLVAEKIYNYLLTIPI